MFKFTNNTFHVTRGDIGSITVKYNNGAVLNNSDISTDLIFKKYEKDELNASPKVYKTTSVVPKATEVTLILDSDDTNALPNPENGKEEYWYELKIGPGKTVLGYDETGAKIFYLYPSGKDKEIN